MTQDDLARGREKEMLVNWKEGLDFEGIGGRGSGSTVSSLVCELMSVKYWNMFF